MKLGRFFPFASLKVRLLTAALVTTLLALGVAGLGMVLLFERHMERTWHEQMLLEINQLAAHINVDPATGRLTLLQRFHDPRFTQPFSGYYWQVTALDANKHPQVDEPQLVSASLWDHTLQVPEKMGRDGKVGRLRMDDGPQGARLTALVRQIVIADDDHEPVAVQIVVARDLAHIREAGARFGHDMMLGLMLLTLVLLLASTVQVYFGLRPLEWVWREILQLRDGRKNQISQHVPPEVLPLTEAVNSLVAAQREALKDAREHAADLAHGLSTPLTAMAAVARKVRERGSADLAEDMEQLTEQMRLHVGREMSRVRIRSGQGVLGERAVSDLSQVAEALFRTLQRTPAGEKIHWQLQASSGARVPMDKQDLTELLGNLLDNAGRHARQYVWVRYERMDNQISLLVEDDGAGIDPARRDSLLQRGARLDDNAQGAGLGLAIVKRIVEVYQGQLTLRDSALGGLCVCIILPSLPQ